MRKIAIIVICLSIVMLFVPSCSGVQHTSEDRNSVTESPWESVGVPVMVVFDSNDSGYDLKGFQNGFG